MTPPLLTWTAFVACLALSFLFSGMESGVFALSRLRIRQQTRAGKASAKVLHRFLEAPENFLWTILVGNTLVNFVILGWLVAALHGRLGARPLVFGVVFTAAVFLFYTLFDLLPKMLFRMYPNRLCLFSARPFRVLHMGLRPAVALVEWMSRLVLRWSGGRVFSGLLFGNREELRQVMQETAQSLTSDKRVMINRVLDLQNFTVRQLTIPMALAVTVEATAPVGDALAVARERGFTRLPVWAVREGRRQVIGLVSLNALLFQPDLDAARAAGEFVRPALYLDENLRLEVALRRMQRGGQRLAVVLAGDQREAGIVTMQDMLKVLFGDVKL